MNSTHKNTNAPEETAAMEKALALLTDDQKAELILISAVTRQNNEQERIKNCEAPALNVEEV